MADAVSVQITSPETGAEAPKETTAPAIPDKFKNEDGSLNTEALLASYTALEQKQSKPATGEEPAADDKTETTDQTTDAEKTATEALKVAGLDISEFNNEFAKEGKLSDDSFKKLEEKGFPRAMVEQFIRGAQAQDADAQAQITDIKAAAGGDEGYTQMVAWAAATLKPEQIAEFNEAVSSGKAGIAKAAVQGLKAQFDAAEGRDPQLINGGGKNTGETFTSWAQVERAMNDPRYGVDPAYTKDIEAKALRSNVGTR